MVARSYLNDGLSLEGQLQATFFPVASSSRRATAGLVLAGLQTLPSEPGSLYGGGHVGIVRGPSPDAVYEGGGSVDTPRTWTAPVIGGTLGYGPFDSGESTRMQVELKANLPIWGDEGEPPMPASGVSVGIFGLLD